MLSRIKMVFRAYSFFRAKQLACLVCSIMCMQTIFAQPDVKTELKKVNKAYRSAENLAMDVTVLVYKDKSDKTGSVLGSGWMKKAGKKYYSKFGKDEMLMNEKGTFVIDNEKKQITYYEAENTMMKNAVEIPDIDSVLSETDSIAYKGEDSDSKQYSFYNENSPIRQTDMFVYKKNSLLKKIIYYYKENNEDENYDMYKVVIDYKNIKLEKPDDAVFSEKKYVVIEQEKLRTTPAYKTYKLKISENE